MIPRQKTLIQETWAQVVPVADQAAAMFYQRLFEIDPEHAHCVQDHRHGAAAQEAAADHCVAVSSLDNLGALTKTVEDLGRRHAGYGVKDAHYDSVGVALLWTLGAGARQRLDPRGGRGLEGGLRTSLRHHAPGPAGGDALKAGCVISAREIPASSA